MKRFIVIGMGNFGSTVAEELLNLDCEVTAIDSDKSRVQALHEHPRLIAILADATDHNFLEKLDIQNADSIVISTGRNSHASILMALHLSELKAKEIVVKANSQEHAKILLKVGATEAVIPERQMAVKVAHSLAQPNLVDYLPLGEDYHIAEIMAPAEFANKNLAELRLRSQYQVQVIATKNSVTNKFNFVIDGDYKIKATDILVILGKQEDINKLRA